MKFPVGALTSYEQLKELPIGTKVYEAGCTCCEVGRIYTYEKNSDGIFFVLIESDVIGASKSECVFTNYWHAYAYSRLRAKRI